MYGHWGSGEPAMKPTREGSRLLFLNKAMGRCGSMTDAPKVEEGLRGSEKVSSGHLWKKPGDAGGNPDASTDLDRGVGSGRSGRRGDTHFGVRSYFGPRSAGSGTKWQKGVISTGEMVN